MKVGLREKILVPTMVVVVLCMALASFFSAKKASDELWSELLQSSGHLAKGLATNAGYFAQDVLGVVVLQARLERVRKVVENPTPENIASTRPALADILKFNPSVQGVNVLDANGDVVLGDDPKAKGNFADREYFKAAIKGAPTISEPIMSRITNKPVVMTAAPIKDGDKIIGVLYARVDLGNLSEELVAPIKVGQSGFAFMISKAGTVFSHPDKEQILKFKASETDWGKKLLAQDAGTVSYSDAGVERTLVFARDKDTGWTAVIALSKADIAQASGSVRNTSMLFGALGIVLACAAIVLVVNTILRDLNSCVVFSGSVAAGELDKDLQLTRDDELGKLAASLQAMVASLREMIGTARQKTAEAEEQTAIARQAMGEAEAAKAQAEHARRAGLLQAAQQLESIVEVLTSASTQLSAQIDESSRGAGQQAMRVDETATAMEEMTATVIEVAKNAAQAAETAGQARAKAQEGAAMVGRVVAGMGEVQTQSDSLKTDMDRLGKQAEDIGRVLTVISDIADQTNLLALNAAIEAARAGDAGRGFAVVADEVRKLAEKTMAATREVGEAIRGIQEGTRSNVAGVEKSVGLIQNVTGQAQASGGALGEIVRLVDSASDQVRSIATASEEQSAASEEINHSIEQVNAISQETSRAMSEAARAVADLAEQAQVLKGLIQRLEQEGRG